MALAQRLPTLFIPHGGGPCFFTEPMWGLPPDAWDRMAAHLCGIDASVGVRPAAVLVVSGHWETERPTLNTAARHQLLYDYQGFPAETYRLTYPVPGAPWLAPRVLALLAAGGFSSDTDDRRGLDHGVFVPFKLIYPDADVPMLQLSLQRDLNSATHLAIGRALAPLRDEGVLIVGSGMSYHNLRDFFTGRGGPAAEAFDAWLGAAVEAGDPAERDTQLERWRSAPGALQAHPEAEHLLPLMIAAGAAGDSLGVRTYADHIAGKALSGFRFG